MGFFDELSEKEENNLKIQNLKNEIKDLFNTMAETYRKLERTVNYSNEFTSLIESALEDFKNYFEARGFTVNKSKFSNVNGLIASKGDSHIEFEYQPKYEFQFTMRPHWGERLSIEDTNAIERLFKGFVQDGEIYINGVNSSYNIENYYLAKENLIQDIKNINDKIESKYTPNLQFCRKSGTHVSSITEFLEALNTELKK